MAKLTTKEHKTLNDAFAVLAKHTVNGASWQIYASTYPTSGFTHDLTYFDSERGHHSLISGRDGKTFADRVENALHMEERAAAHRERSRARRIDSLRKELSELTGEDVAA